MLGPMNGLATSKKHKIEKPDGVGLFLIGGDEETRTPDPLHAKHKTHVNAISAISQKSRGNLDGFWLFRLATHSVVVRRFPPVSGGLAELDQPEK